MKDRYFELILLILIISITCCNSPSSRKDIQTEQDEKKQQVDFNGIFEFKINKTTISALDTLKYLHKEITIKDRRIEQIKEQDWDLLCDGVRKFKLTDFNKGTIEFSLVELTFYDDTLIKFSSLVNYEMDEILRSKYPNYVCTNNENESVDKWTNQSIYAQWRYDKKYGASFIIYDTDKSVKIMLETDKAKADYLKKENKDL